MELQVGVKIKKNVWKHHLLFDDTTYKKLSSFRQQNLSPTHSNQPIATNGHYHQAPPKKWCGLWSTKSHPKKNVASSPALLESASAARPGAWRNSARGDVSWVLFFRHHHHHPNHRQKRCFPDFFGIRNESKLLLRGIWKNAPTVEEAQNAPSLQKRGQLHIILRYYTSDTPNEVFGVSWSFMRTWHSFGIHLPKSSSSLLYQNPADCGSLWTRWLKPVWGCILYHVSTPSPVYLGTPLRSKITSTNLKWWASKWFEGTWVKPSTHHPLQFNSV